MAAPQKKKNPQAVALGRRRNRALDANVWRPRAPAVVGATADRAPPIDAGLPAPFEALRCQRIARRSRHGSM
jgi:hypothetical protein